MSNSSRDSQEFPLPSGRLSRFSVLPNIPEGQQIAIDNEETNSERTTENKDHNLHRSVISKNFNPYEVLPQIEKKTYNSSHSSLGYFKVEFPDSDTKFDDSLCGRMTSSVQYIKQLLHDNDTILLVGVPGSGKTTLGRQLLQCLINDYKPVQVFSVTQLVQMVKFDDNQLIFFDDAFGRDKSNFDITLWKTLSCTWQEKVNKKKRDSKSTKLILSTRKESLPYTIPFASFFVDMSNDSVFGHEDKKMLLDNTKNIKKTEIDNLIYHFGEEISNEIGFPLCSVLYTFFSLDASEFFTDPLKFLLSSYQNFISESEMADCISNILVFNAGTFRIDAKLNINTEELINKVTTVRDVLTFSNSVMRLFLNITNENIIQFIHPILLTAAEIHMYNINQQKGLENMSIKTINKYIHLKGKLSKKKLFGILEVNYLSSENLCLLAEKMLSEVFDGNIRHVCSHPFLKTPKFIQYFQDALQKKYCKDEAKMIQILNELFTVVDDISCDGILFWSAHYGNTKFCEMLLRHFVRCRKREKLSLNMLSRALIGACLNNTSLILVIQLNKYGADISYCDACFRSSAPAVKFEVIDDFHFCPLQASMQSGNLQSFKYLLTKGAIISHSKWIHWELLCKLAEVSKILTGSFDFVLALEETFSKRNNLNILSKRQADDKGIYSTFKAMLKDIQDPSNINDIFFTFVHHSFINQAICAVFNSCGLDITYCDRKQRNAINVLLSKYKEDPQRIPLNEVSCIRSLLKIGLDPNNTAVDGTFPLCLAIGKKSTNIKVINMLLQAGARADNRTLDGLTPLHLCIKSCMPLEKKLSLILLLLEYGAKRDETDLRNRTYAQIIFEQLPIQSHLLLKLSDWPLHECLCSRLGDTEKIKIIKELVTNDIDVNNRDQQNQTPLVLSACKLNNMSLTKAILSVGGDANILYEDSSSLIQKLLISRHANVEGIFNMLVERYGNVYHANEEGDTALLTALRCQKNRYQEIKTLLNMTMNDLTELETENKNQQSVLHLATASSALTDTETCDICKTYISVCGKVNDRDIFDKTALEYATLCSKQRTKSICLLLQHSNIFEIGSSIILNLIQNRHMSNEISTMLFNEKYYDSIVQEDEYILHKLASTCPVTVSQISLPLRHLCESGIDIDLPDLNGNTPLIKSCCSTINVGLSMELIKRGADVNLQNVDGNTALHECILSSSPDPVLNLICKLFMKNNFNFSIRNGDGLSVFHLIVENLLIERSETFNTILKATNDINLTDLKGNTVLHKIIMLSENDMNVSLWVAEVLDSSDNVDTEIKGSCGRTVLNMACSYSKSSRFSTILVLLNYDVDVNSRDKYGNTPIYNAVNFLKGHDLKTVFERFIRVLALLSLGCDLEGNRTDTPVQLSQACQYNDIYSILTKYELSNAVGFLNDIVEKLLRRYQKRITVTHLTPHKNLSKEIVNIINKAYSRIVHLRFDTDDDLELSSDYVNVNMSPALYSHRQSENFSTQVRESSSGANSLSEDCIDSKVNYSHNDVSSRSSETTRNSSPSHSGYGTLDYNTSTDDNYGQYESRMYDDQDEDDDD